MQLKAVTGEEVEVDHESVNGMECCSEWTRRVLKGCGCAHGLEISTVDCRLPPHHTAVLVTVPVLMFVFAVSFMVLIVDLFS